MNTALSVIKIIGDKLIRDTPFRYRLDVAPVNSSFVNVSSCGMQSVDFGRTFGLGKPALAYAYTSITASLDQELTIEIEHSDGCKIWLNGEVVYQQAGDRRINLRFEERNIEMSGRFNVSLQKGVNALLIKSETRGVDWRIHIQSPSRKGAVVSGATQDPTIGLLGVPDVDAKIASLTNWLVCGPFANSQRDLDAVHAPETEFRFGRMYPGLNEPVTWTIPRVEILGGPIDPLPWGTNYDWNYHNGGVAWAMQHLGEVTGDASYNAYANRFCDFHLEGAPFVRYQVKALKAINSANHYFMDTPLLDFTLAPSLPFIYRLRKEPSFAHRDLYESHIDGILRYARHEQVRLPGHGIYTRTTPEKFTTWVDDMFMGIPFLVQAALYVSDPAEQQAFWDDAASQVLEFNSQVWDDEASLYMHARVFGSPAKMPHWSRCNGWAIWAMSEVLMNLRPDHPKWAAILEHYRKHVLSLVRLQDSSGFWFNVLDRPDSRKEVSGTAIFAMTIARGVRLGWLDADGFKPIVAKAWAAIESAVDPDGTVHDICYGTMCTEDVEYYIHRPFYDNDTHGLFAVLFAGLEVAKLP